MLGFVRHPMGFTFSHASFWTTSLFLQMSSGQWKVRRDNDIDHYYKDFSVCMDGPPLFSPRRSYLLAQAGNRTFQEEDQGNRQSPKFHRCARTL
ncbi:hypothetical protein BOV94_12475 [Solemya velum gill symbiont]|nr:hypothetical protein BOV94_12475 [Solemya velum gill symbiont]